MKLLVLGVNHETAPVDVREKIAFSPEQTQSALAELKALDLAEESIILSTCNRTEIYTLETDSSTQIRHWLHQYFDLTPDSIDDYLYEHSDLEAIKHIMRVSSGLNSLVLGEPQILGQMKEAYSTAQKSKSIEQCMDSLFQHVFKTAKQIRTDTAIGSSPVSIAFSAVALSKQFFGDLSEQTALLIGAGETCELVARHLKEGNIGNIIIANRTLSKAHQLAEKLGGYAIELSEIENHLHEADLIISSTASPDPILLKPQVKQALKKRRNKPMFMIDIAVPRDIEPSIGDFSDTYLYTVDDLQEIIDENKRSRMDASLKAEEILEYQASHFLTEYHSKQQVGPLIQNYRSNAYDLRDTALQDALHQLENGDAAAEVLTKLANQLTNKLLHTPTTQLRKASLNGNAQVIQAAKQILLAKTEDTLAADN